MKYSLVSDRVKEDIIVENAAALESVALKLPDEYDYALQADMSVRVLDKETKESVFEYLPPLVYDSAEPANSTVANVVLTPHRGYMRMAYELDEAFLNEAVYPIIIDPVTISSSANTNVEDTTVCQETPTSNYSTYAYMKVGIQSSKENVALIRFKKLARLKGSDTVLQAQLKLTMKSGSTSSFVGAYAVKQQWTESSVNWNTLLPTDTSKIDSYAQECVAGAGANKVITLDLTNLFRSWYLKQDGADGNFGVALRRPQNVSGDHYQEIHSANHSTSSYRPVMYVNYISHGKLIMHMKKRNDQLHFYYDAQNRPAMVKYGSAIRIYTNYRAIL